MPDKRTTELTAIDVVLGTDLVMVVDDPSGTAVSKKATVTQVLVNTAKINAPNTFTGDQIIDGDLVVTGEINPVRLAEQLAKATALEGRAPGDASGSRTLLSASLIAGLSMRHDEEAGEARITVGNYDTQVYQPLVLQAEQLQIHTGLSPVIAEHLRVHPSGGVTIGTFHLVDPGVGTLVAGGLGATPLDASQLQSGSVPLACLHPDVLTVPGGFPGGQTFFLREDGTFAAPPSGLVEPVVFSQDVTGNANLTFAQGYTTLRTGEVRESWTVLGACNVASLVVSSITQVSSGNPGLKFGVGVNYPALRAQPSGVAMLEVTSADTPSSAYMPLRAAYFISMASGNSFPDLTVTGATNFAAGLWVSAGDVNLSNGKITTAAGGNTLADLTCGPTNFQSGLVVSAGNVTVTSGIWAQNLHLIGYMYPGRIDLGGAPAQTSWFIAGHGSYGLYCNTGFYAQGQIWSGTSLSAPSGAFTGAVTANTLTSTGALTCGSVECSAHIRWAGGNYWSWDGTSAFLSSPGNVRLALPNAGAELQVPGYIRINGAGSGMLLVNDEYQNGRIDCDTTRYYFRGPTASVGANSVFPIPGNACWLGNGSYPWYAVCAYVGTIQPSDATIKHSIEDSDLGLAFVEKLRPRRYKFNHDPTQEHIGFTTQEVEAAMEGRPFAVIQHPEDHGHIGPSGLNYAGFVPVLTKAVQELSARLRTLEGTWKN